MRLLRYHYKQEHINRNIRDNRYNMQDYQIINKIKKLESIKPGKDWVVSTKQQIIGYELDHSKISTLDWFFIAFKKPVLVLSSVLFIGIIITGAVLFSNFQSVQPEIASNKTEALVSLQNLEAKLGEINLSLGNLEKAEDQSQALAIAGIIKLTAGNIEENIDKIGPDTDKSQEYENQILAVINVSKEVKEMAENKQGEMIEFLINDYKQRTLSEDNQERLEKLEKSYNNGEYGQAILWIQAIQNNINNN